MLELGAGFTPIAKPPSQGKVRVAGKIHIYPIPAWTGLTYNRLANRPRVENASPARSSKLLFLDDWGLPIKWHMRNEAMRRRPDRDVNGGIETTTPQTVHCENNDTLTGFVV